MCQKLFNISMRLVVGWRESIKSAVIWNEDVSKSRVQVRTAQQQANKRWNYLDSTLKRPRRPPQWPASLWTTITSEGIELESQWRHHWIRERIPHLSRYVARTCDVIVTTFEGKTVFALAKKTSCVHSTSHRAQTSTLETNFLHKNFGKDLAFTMMIKKLKIFLVGDPTGPKPRISDLFAVQATFLPVSTHEPHQICRKDVFGCFTPSHDISSQNVDRNILFLKKIKISTGWQRHLFFYFLVITPQPLRLAANKGL